LKSVSASPFLRGEREALLREHNALQASSASAGESPLILERDDRRLPSVVRMAACRWAHGRNEIETVLNLADTINHACHGQRPASK